MCVCARERERENVYKDVIARATSMAQVEFLEILFIFNVRWYILLQIL